MGTNYYLNYPACPHCGRGDEPLHIGKSSCGWVFALHVIPDEGINDLPDWIARWSKPDAVIRDEYGDVVSPEKMLAIITIRRNERSWDVQRERLPYGYSSWEKFHQDNGSIEGPNGLLRCRDGERGVRHGNGTYDLHTREFS